MPKLHSRKGGDGYYVRSRHGNSMSTFQVSDAGVQALRKSGYGDGDELPVSVVSSYCARGLMYTGGSGPGEVTDLPVSAYASPTAANEPSPDTRQHAADNVARNRSSTRVYVKLPAAASYPTPLAARPRNSSPQILETKVTRPDTDGIAEKVIGAIVLAALATLCMMLLVAIFNGLNS